MNLAELKPVAIRQTIASGVYAHLRAALMEGAFEAGASFAISDLAVRFGTSNTPVREALRRLTDAGALVEGKWNTATLPPLSPAYCTDLFTARRVIEGGAAGLAAEKMTAERMTALRVISDRHRSALVDGRLADMLSANKDFHFTIYLAAGRGILMEQIENLWLRSGPYTRFLSERMQEILMAQDGIAYARHHEDILDALTRGDGEAARNAMQADINAVHDWTQAWLAARNPGASDG